MGLNFPSLIGRMYIDPVKRVMQAVGLHETLVDLYGRSVSSYTRTVNSVTATFTVSDIGDLNYLQTDREYEVIADLLKHTTQDDIFFDVGGNIGLYSCLIGTKLTEGHVVAFEPIPDIATRLRRNLEENSLTDRAEVQQCVLADDTGEVVLKRQGERASESTIAATNTGNTLPVQMNRGDDLVKSGELPHPTVVKIDVEGAELRVLRGMKETLMAESCRLVYCEVHQQQLPEFDSTPAEVESFIYSLGFQTETIYEREHAHFIRGRKAQS